MCTDSLYSCTVTIVPVGVGPGMFKYALLDQMVLKRFESAVARYMVLQSIAVNAKVYLGLGVLSGSMLTLVLGPGCPWVGLDGPGVGRSLPEDLVVLEAGTDGPVSTGEWS